jgi:hypothetical protein
MKKSDTLFQCTVNYREYKGYEFYAPVTVELSYYGGNYAATHFVEKRETFTFSKTHVCAIWIYMHPPQKTVA